MKMSESNPAPEVPDSTKIENIMPLFRLPTETQS